MTEKAITLQASETVPQRDFLSDPSAIQHAQTRMRSVVGRQILDHLMRCGAGTAQISIESFGRTMDDGALRILYAVQVEPEYPSAYHQGFAVGNSYKRKPDLGRENPAREDNNPYLRSDPRRGYWLAGYQDGLTKKVLGFAESAEQ